MSKARKIDAQNSKSQALRVAQHESVHTLNAILQQSAFASFRSILKNELPPTSARKGCQYVQSLARKATLRLDVSIKRSICRKCHSFLLPGITCTTRIRSSKPCDLVLLKRCSICGAHRKLPCPAIEKKRFKSLARRHKKKQSKIDNRKVSRKVETATQGAVKVDDKDVLFTSEQMKGRLSQRARRRAAQDIKERSQQVQFGRSVSRRTRKRKQQKDISSHDEDQMPILQSVGQKRFSSSHFHGKMKEQSASKTPKRKRRGLKVDLPPYHERLQSTSNLETHWMHDIPDSTSEVQLQALRTLRGDHLVTVGLGKGGVVGDRE